MNKIKSQIRKYLTGEESASVDAIIAIQEHLKDVINAGVENDADAMIFALRISNKIYVVLLAGKSILTGEGVKDYFNHYFADAKGAERHLNKIVDYLYDDISGRTSTATMLRESNTIWRAYRPLLDINEIYKQAGILK